MHLPGVFKVNGEIEPLGPMHRSDCGSVFDRNVAAAIVVHQRAFGHGADGLPRSCAEKPPLRPAELSLRQAVRGPPAIQAGLPSRRGRVHPLPKSAGNPY